MKSVFAIIFLSVIARASYSQSADNIKTRLETLFRPNIDRYNEGDVWETNNDDSSYYKSKIIKMYNGGHYHDKKYCYFKRWEFINPQVYELASFHWCEEPPALSIFGNVFQISFEITGNHLYLKNTGECKNGELFEVRACKSLENQRKS
jgi:hypothetical protein